MRRKLFLLLLPLVISACVSAEAQTRQPPASFAGEWETSWGRMTLTQKGAAVTGRYTHDRGKIAGTVTGNILRGTWSEHPSYKPPTDAGDVEFTLSADGKSIAGRWRYGSEGTWHGDWKCTLIHHAIDRGEWAASFEPATRDCLLFPTAVFGELMVTEVKGDSSIRVGQKQKVNVGAFRLDQFSPEQKRFGCEMLLQFQNGRLKGKVESARATLDTAIAGNLTLAELNLKPTGLEVRLVAESGNVRVVRRGNLNPIPLGFANEEEWREFSNLVRRHLSVVMKRVRPGKPPLAGVSVLIIGSAVKGRSGGKKNKDGGWDKEPGVPFDGGSEPSDIDFTIISPELFEEGRKLGCNVKQGGRNKQGRPVRRISENCEELEGRERPTAKAGGHPELTRMREALEKLLAANVPERFKGQKRPVNYVVADSLPVGIAHIELPLGERGASASR